MEYVRGWCAGRARDAWADGLLRRAALCTFAGTRERVCKTPKLVCIDGIVQIVPQALSRVHLVPVTRPRWHGKNKVEPDADVGSVYDPSDVKQVDADVPDKTKHLVRRLYTRHEAWFLFRERSKRCPEQRP